MAINQAYADDSVTVQEVKELKARLKQLEQRLDAQAKEQKQIAATAYRGPITKGGVPVAYQPPQPWDKKWHMNGITVTPGGFFADGRCCGAPATNGADIGDCPFGSIPFAQASARSYERDCASAPARAACRPWSRARSIRQRIISGYGELDFLGAANTANSNESNSYNPRIRHMYTTMD